MRLAIGQLRALDAETAEFARQLGISSVQFNNPAIAVSDGIWAYDTLDELRTGCESAGLRLEAIENGPPEFMRDIVAGGADRERQLDNYCQTIVNVGRAGIPFLGYHFMPTGVWRTDMRASGRGGSAVTAFDIADIGRGNAVAPTVDFPITEESLWQNYQVFISRVLPVAESAGVRLALHPDDPPMRSVGRAARIFYSLANMRRARELASSPAWSVDLCLGTVSEMPEGPAAVEDAIQSLGAAGAIGYVHFRQVRGTVPCFQECFLGEGSYSAFRALRLLAEIGFDGFLIDDHVPALSVDSSWGHRSHAHAIGYMQALLEAVTSS